MTKWEYTRVYTKDFDEVRSMGERGWELVTVDFPRGMSLSAEFYFKRPKKETND